MKDLQKTLDTTEETISFQVTNNGFNDIIEYDSSTVKNILIPLIKSISKMKKEGKIIVFLAAPPGAGKTSLSKVIEMISDEFFASNKIVSIGLDGFHHNHIFLTNNHIVFEGERMPLSSIKGSPITYNVDHFIEKLKEYISNDVCYWPTYDRNIHDVIEDSFFIDSNILFVEGNWLLLNDDKWNEARKYCDFSIFITADLTLIKERLIERKCKGGLSKKDAEEFYERSDSKNVMSILSNSVEPDIRMEFLEHGKRLSYISRKIR